MARSSSRVPVLMVAFATQMHPYLNNADLLEWCKEKGVHVTAYAPLGNVNPEFASALEDSVIGEIAARVSKTPAQACCTLASLCLLQGWLLVCSCRGVFGLDAAGSRDVPNTPSQRGQQQISFLYVLFVMSVVF